MYCNTCGKENPDNTKFCPGCGTPANAIAPAPDNSVQAAVPPVVTPVAPAVDQPVELPVAPAVDQPIEPPAAPAVAPAVQSVAQPTAPAMVTPVAPAVHSEAQPERPQMVQPPVSPPVSPPVTPAAQPMASSAAPPQYQQAQPKTNQQNAQGEKKTVKPIHGPSLAGGIISLVLSLTIVLGFFGLIVGIINVSVASALKKHYRTGAGFGFSLAGLIIGAIDIALPVVLGLLGIAALDGLFGGLFGGYFDFLNFF